MSKPHKDVALHPRVLELLASRICHDLISPVTAVNNGVELVEDLGEDGQEEAWGLIASSAKQASDKLTALRLAYGAAGSDGNVTLADIRKAFSALIAGGRTKLEWPDAALSADAAPAGFAKAVLNALILASECNAHNAVISLSPLSMGLTIEVVGDSVSFRAGAAEALAGTSDVSTLDPRTVHAFLTGCLARHFGICLATDFASRGRIVFTLTYA